MPEPRFLWGTHFSSAAAVIYYLVRAVPGAMLKLQGGRFDESDRLFNSLLGTWMSVTTSTSDVKELIPEFFALTDSELPVESGARANGWYHPGDFLCNLQNLDFGTRQDGGRVDNVGLPPWAHNSAEQFIKMNRAALESEHVSQRLHEWIDLIFGCRSKSVTAHTLYFTDVKENQTYDSLIQFGKTPKRLFNKPHSRRSADAAALSVVSTSLWGNHLDRKKPKARGFLKCIAESGESKKKLSLYRSSEQGKLGLKCNLQCKDGVLLSSYRGKDSAIALYDSRSFKRIRATKSYHSVCEIAPPIALLSSSSFVFTDESSRLMAFDVYSGSERLLSSDYSHSSPITALCCTRSAFVSTSADSTNLWSWGNGGKNLLLRCQLDPEGVVRHIACVQLRDQNVRVI
uniref:BEACH domain-containing protein n=1 Tax=Rhodosorus marinus TaxID=101924 RepID=A0A7S2ZTN2_9RHOD|mmetsp:Transcript_32291/g.126425  ORF Transcript_32291/g.126425 Transcript_32291/m.126425 type:complete len:401 (+) Transcript_32291:1569-2771(+)